MGYRIIMNNYDNNVLGVGNSQHPANQQEIEAEPVYNWNNLTEAYDSGHEHVFKEKQDEIIKEAEDILYVLISIESGLCGRLTELINKLK
jgi:hypothetical protein